MSTHARNIIFVRQRVVPPAPAPLPPGQVRDLRVETPNTSDSGAATVTFRSPEGWLPGQLDYRIVLTGGPYTINSVTIVAS